MPTRLQFCSDLHLEFRNISEIPKLLKNINASTLILAGDIVAINDEEDYDKFIAFLDYYCPKYKFVIAISGNHELYYTGKDKPLKSHCMDMVHKKFKSLNKTYPNYIYLDCDTITLLINGSPYTFIGATLWTKVKDEDWLTVEKSMNDYNSIFTMTKGIITKFNVNYMQMLHKKHRNFIKREIAKQDKNIPIILITHHRPILPPEGHISKIDQAYTTDMSDIIKSPVSISISGHCHSTLDTSLNGVRYLANPKGYPNQRCNYKSDAFIEI
jgi:predicted MPP superfamily phosphohydrolase